MHLKMQVFYQLSQNLKKSKEMKSRRTKNLQKIIIIDITAISVALKIKSGITWRMDIVNVLGAIC